MDVEEILVNQDSVDRVGRRGRVQLRVLDDAHRRLHVRVRMKIDMAHTFRVAQHRNTRAFLDVII